MRLMEWEKFHDSLIQFKVPFKVLKTSMTIKIQSIYGSKKANGNMEDDFITQNDDSVLRSEMWFIKKVKNYCETLKLEFNIDKEKIKYVSVPRRRPGTVIKNIIEIDLNSAYWNFAFKEGIISEDIYKIGRDGYFSQKHLKHKFINKRTRLVALGALAKKTFIWDFNGSEWVCGGVLEAPKADYFFRCCELTGTVMNNLKYVAGDNFIFFWVDAIFFREIEQKRIEKYLKLINLEFKTYVIDAVVYEKDRILVYSQERYFAEKSEPRTFFLKKQDFDLLNK